MQSVGSLRCTTTVFRHKPARPHDYIFITLLSHSISHAAQDLGPSPDTLQEVREISPEEASKRMAEGERVERERLATRGKDVSPEAQFVFDAIHKT